MRTTLEAPRQHQPPSPPAPLPKGEGRTLGPSLPKEDGRRARACRRAAGPIVLVVLVVACLRGVPGMAADAPPPQGKVYLVGMGPGDAELVTLKAARVLKDADCVFCFSYLKDEVARYAPPEKITVASPLLMGRVCGRESGRTAG